MTDAEALADMLKIVEEGGAVLTAGEIHDDIPTIHGVSHHEGARLHTDDEVRHLGWGFFLAMVGGEKISFDAGGAMRRAETFSWSPLIASAEALAAMGYDMDAARAAISGLVNAPEGA